MSRAVIDRGSRRAVIDRGSRRAANKRRPPLPPRRIESEWWMHAQAFEGTVFETQPKSRFCVPCARDSCAFDQVRRNSVCQGCHTLVGWKEGTAHLVDQLLADVPATNAAWWARVDTTDIGAMLKGLMRMALLHDTLAHWSCVGILQFFRVFLCNLPRSERMPALCRVWREAVACMCAPTGTPIRWATIQDRQRFGDKPPAAYFARSAHRRVALRGERVVLVTFRLTCVTA